MHQSHGKEQAVLPLFERHHPGRRRPGYRTGELKFGTTGTTIVALPTLTLDLGGAGNLISSGTGTSNLNSNCTGTGSLTATPGGIFDVATVVVDAGKEMLFLVTTPAITSPDISCSSGLTLAGAQALR